MGIQFRITESAEESDVPVITGQFSAVFGDFAMNVMSRVVEQGESENQIITRMREKFENEVIPHVKKQLKVMSLQKRRKNK